MAFAVLGDAKHAWELLNMLNPVNHGLSADDIASYKAEPYVVAADVYALPPHAGRGGWTWYTGSAGWMYRLILESLLGIRLDVDRLHVSPIFPPGWNAFKLHYRYREAVYHISVLQGSAGEQRTSVTVDGVLRYDNIVPLVDDGREHSVEVRVV